MRSAAWISILVFTLTSAISCVSVSIAKNEAKHATGVQLKTPTSPFQAEARTDVDGAWKNSRNGNLISYLSDCSDETDPGLESITQGALAGLSELKIETASAPMIQEREARRVLATGKVDGVSTKIDLVTFKRNHCIFLITYVGVIKSFADDHAQFDRFVDGFRAP